MTMPRAESKHWVTVTVTHCTTLNSVADNSSDDLSMMEQYSLHDIAPTNPHLARMVGYGPFTLCVIIYGMSVLQ
jgi:hypothetical protein